MDREKDIPYAYDLYNRVIEHVLVSGTPLRALLIHNRYNLWDTFAQSALMVDCTQFSALRTYASVRHHYTQTAEGTYGISAFVLGMLTFFLTGIAAIVLVVSRRRVLVFSVDKVSDPWSQSDFRIGRVYRGLVERRVRYIEFFHSLLGAGLLRRAWQRGRVGLYLEGIDWAYFLVRRLRRTFVARTSVSITGLDSFTPDEREFVTALVTKYVSVAPLVAFRITAITRILRSSAIRTVIGIDDVRSYHELGAAARALGIPFYALQHGHYTPYHVGWLKDARLLGERMYPETLVVWNQYWKQELARLAGVWGSAHVLVGGSAKAGPSQPLVRSAQARVVVVPYETEAPRALVQAAITELAASGVRILFKLRPDVAKTVQLATLGDAAVSVEAVSTIAEPVSVVIGTYSTYLYDAIEAGIPTGLLESNLQYGDGLRRNNLAEVLPTATVKSAIVRLIDLPEGVVAARAERLRVITDFDQTLAGILKANGVV